MTGGFNIDRFVNLPMFTEADDGTTLHLMLECYVVPNISTELLLREDFQVNHEISTIRSIKNGSIIKVGSYGFTLPARSTPKSQ